MIRFKCIYCGQRMLAQEDGRGKKGKCPKCNHIVVVPRTTKGRPAISSDKEPMPDRSKPRVPEWDRDAQSLPDDASDMLVELYKESFRPFIPTYDKLSLFLMAVTLLLLFITNSNKMIEDMIGPLKQMEDIWRPLCIIVSLPGMFVCLYHVFTSREKTNVEKLLMILFAVPISAFTGIVASNHIIKESASWLLIFPIWNIINCVLLLLMLYVRIIDEECISDRDATLVQIILGLAAVLIIFILCNYVFKLYWAITFSICIVYTTSFDRALQNIFPGLTYREDEQPF